MIVSHIVSLCYTTKSSNMYGSNQSIVIIFFIPPDVVLYNQEP